MKRLPILFLLYAANGAVIAQQASANPDGGSNPPQQPAQDNTQQVPPVKTESQSAAAPTVSAPVRLEGRSGRIGDPTQMTGSFSQALSRVHGKPGTAGGGQAVGSGLPKIELSAKVFRHNSKAAMLNVLGKNHMIKEGGKFSVLENNTLHEIQVDKIENDHVEITLQPAGRKMVLE